ncbi:LarC family nickel insertion protein, partial [Omnitrophica bacterium]|nr:LarC family nickel insertion protein [Candidatus Omnitrophota bacterium]
YSSPVTVGAGGIIMTKGGALPVPAPATLCLLKGMPLVSSGIRSELVTPTGAALLASLIDGFIDFPNMVLKNVGYGAGTYNINERPNCLRVMIGQVKGAFLEDKIFVLEANIDDMNPVDYEYLIERLFKNGALDAYLTPVQMKKTRPGVLLTVLAEKAALDRLSTVIFNESTTIGVRYYEAARKKLKRDFINVRTRYGDIKAKVSSGPYGIKKIVPEYEDCKRAAGSKKVPLSEVRKEVERIT